jgi:hypothetical protein
MYVLGLGVIKNRVIKDHNDETRICHSLNSYNFLKLESSNFLSFERGLENRVISV